MVDPYPSSMSQTSCRRKKPSRWKSINTHTHTPPPPPSTIINRCPTSAMIGLTAHTISSTTSPNCSASSHSLTAIMRHWFSNMTKKIIFPITHIIVMFLTFRENLWGVLTIRTSNIFKNIQP